MRLFKSRNRTDEYHDVSSVVANENDPNVKIVSCSSQQEFHSNDNESGNKTTEPNQGHSGGYNDDDDDKNQKKVSRSFDRIQNYSNCNENNIPKSVKETDNKRTDKFTPIPDCDKFDETVPASFHCGTSNDSSTTLAETTIKTTTITTITTTSEAATLMEKNIPETLQRSNSTSDFINNLFGMFTRITLD